MMITPEVISAMPTSAGVSSACLDQNQATIVISTIASPDQMA